MSEPTEVPIESGVFDLISLVSKVDEVELQRVYQLRADVRNRMRPLWERSELLAKAFNTPYFRTLSARDMEVENEDRIGRIARESNK